MKLTSLLKISIFLLSSFSIISLTSCGGSGGDEGSSALRPRSLDGVTMVLPGASFTFIRNATAPSVDSPGDTETGTVQYAPGGTNSAVFTTLDPTANLNLTVIYPVTAEGLTYSYQAIDASSGTITISQKGTSSFRQFTPFITTLVHTYFASSATPAGGGAVGGSHTITVNFANDGSAILPSVAEFSDLDDTLNNVQDLPRGRNAVLNRALDTINEVGLPAGFGPDPQFSPISTTLANFNVDGSGLPVGYTASQNPTPRGIQEPTLNLQTIVFTDNANTTDSFNLNFTRDTGFSDADLTEEGTVVFTDPNVPGRPRQEGRYVYEELTTSNNSTLTITSDRPIPNNIPEEGVITLQFTSVSSPSPAPTQLNPNPRGTSRAAGTYISAGTGNQGNFIIQ